MASHSGAVLAAAGGGGGDKLSALGDSVLGNILSFLPADEAARAAALSRRWRHVAAHVHAVSLDEPDPPIPDYDGDWSPGYSVPVNRNAVRAPPFADAVSAALLARLHRGRGEDAAPPPLHALRVGFHRFTRLSAGIVDAWLAYALRQAAAAGELHLDLRLRREPVCGRAYSLRRPGGADAADTDESESYWKDEYPASSEIEAAGDGASPASPPSDEDDDEEPPRRSMNEYVTPRSLFSCAALRSLRIGPCRLDLPAAAAIALPSLSTLHLTGAGGRRGAVQRLVSACPRLADLTLESCGEGLTRLSLVGARRLRRLALRCCHGLAAVAADASELRAFEYRGAVPGPSFLTLRGGAGAQGIGITSCALDFCGGEAAAAAELANLAGFLRLFAGVERLRLTSARLGCGGAFPAFPALRHLHLTGMLPDDDTYSSAGGAAAVAAVARILRRAPELETLTLFFLPEPEDLEETDYYDVDEEELLDGHKLRYDRHAALAVPEDAGIACLREKTREINLVHYEGGVAQRTLAKFLLRNAMVGDEVCAEFGQGPLWIQTRLMEEINGWVRNKSAKMMFI